MTDKRPRIIHEWHVETAQTIEALNEWRINLRRWEAEGCDDAEFHAALLALRSAGLEQWADRNLADLDALADAVMREAA